MDTDGNAPDVVDSPFQQAYHRANTDTAGYNLELRRRLEIAELLEENHPDSFYGRKSKDVVLSIPNTTDLVGVLKGNVPWEPIYKRGSDVTQSDWQMLGAFLEAYNHLMESEVARLKGGKVILLPGGARCVVWEEELPDYGEEDGCE